MTVPGPLTTTESGEMSELKLIALDEEDLKVVSAHLQDAVGRIADVVYDRPARRFAMVLNRFDWADPTALSSSAKDAGEYRRRQCGFRFERVSAVRSKGIDREDRKGVLSLLAIDFAQGEAPSGRVTLYFSGGPQIELDVECIEAELRDLGAAWTTASKPQHPDAGDAEA